MSRPVLRVVDVASPKAVTPAVLPDSKVAGPTTPTAVVKPDTPALCRDIFFEFLEHQGIPYVFGNPGTTELPLVDGCAEHPSIRYVLSLHEDIAVAQAMGYARASGKVGVVNLHVAPGVAHGLGNLYNAFRARVPLLVTAGQHHTGLMIQEPILTANLAELVRPFTKWAYEVTAAEELPIALQRAFKELTTPPYGPVFLSFPMNLLLQRHDGFPRAQVSRLATATPDADSITRAAQVLTSAENPLIIAGDGVGHADAWNQVVRLAQALGAPVRTEGYSTRWNFPADHPLYAGPISNLPTVMRDTFAHVDVALMLGVTAQAPVSRYDERGPLVPWRVRVVSVDDSPWDVGKNQPVEVGLVGAVRGTLDQLSAAVEQTPLDSHAVTRRTRSAIDASGKRRDAWRTKVHEAQAAGRTSGVISATLVAAELRQLLPPDAVFVDETISNRESFVNVLTFGDPQSYFAANGLSLGYSAAAAVGIQMALPHRRVVNVVGDGSLMYYPQALWNAAHEGTPVLFVVLNNRQYRVLKLIVDRLGGPWGSNQEMPSGLDIGGPGVDFVGLAASVGVAGERARTPGELRAALQRGLGAPHPYLVDVTLDQSHDSAPTRAGSSGRSAEPVRP